MNRKPVGKEQEFQELTARPSAAMPATPDKSAALCVLRKTRREEAQLNAQYEQRRQVLESRNQRIEELQKDYKNAHKLNLSVDPLILKDEDASQTVEKAGREFQEVLQKEDELARLKEKYAQLVKRKQEQELQAQRHYVYWDFMEKVLKKTMFEDVDSLTAHLESHLHLRNQLYRRYSDAQEEADQQRKALVSLEDQHHLTQLEQHNQLSKLKCKLDETRSEALRWERTWDQIQEKATKKRLLLGKIKMAVLNIFEMAGGNFEGEESVSMNDTEKQLDRIKLFIQEFKDILRLYQIPSDKDSDEQKIERPKKATGTHHKKH